MFHIHSPFRWNRISLFWSNSYFEIYFTFPTTTWLLITLQVSSLSILDVLVVLSGAILHRTKHFPNTFCVHYKILSPMKKWSYRERGLIANVSRVLTEIDYMSMKMIEKPRVFRLGSISRWSYIVPISAI